jgi:hypothetical protein
VQGLRKTSTILDLFALVPRLGYSVILGEGIMAKTETIRARVEAKLKADAEAVLDELGLMAGDQRCHSIVLQASGVAEGPSFRGCHSHRCEPQGDAGRDRGTGAHAIQRHA